MATPFPVFSPFPPIALLIAFKHAPEAFNAIGLETKPDALNVGLTAERHWSYGQPAKRGAPNPAAPRETILRRPEPAAPKRPAPKVVALKQKVLSRVNRALWRGGTAAKFKEKARRVCWDGESRSFARMRRLHLQHRFFNTPGHVEREADELLGDGSRVGYAADLDVLYLGNAQHASASAHDSPAVGYFISKLHAPNLRHLSIVEEVIPLGCGVHIAPLIAHAARVPPPRAL